MFTRTYTARFLVACSLLGYCSTGAASYTSPLSVVRIDTTAVVHTPALVYGIERESTKNVRAKNQVTGAEYTGQLLHDSGYGGLVGLSLMRSALSIDVPRRASGSIINLTGTGYDAAVQLRAYKMLWAGESARDEEGRLMTRPSALTLFGGSNLRYSEAERTDEGDRGFTARALRVTVGVGLMAELAITNWLSVCPSAWVAPDVLFKSNYDGPSFIPVETKRSGSFKKPVRTAVDIWLYPFGTASEEHVTLSFLTSLVDRDKEGDGDAEFAVTLSYTF